jgi:hypothetical protein
MISLLLKKAINMLLMAGKGGTREKTAQQHNQK